jgi:hypothetical protein
MNHNDVVNSRTKGSLTMPKPLLAIRIGRSSPSIRAMLLVTSDLTRMPGGVFIDIENCIGTASVGLAIQSVARDGALL